MYTKAIKRLSKTYIELSKNNDMVIMSQKIPFIYDILIILNPGGFLMDTKTKKRRRAFVDTKDCVACGCCVKVCPKDAIKVWKGVLAKVDMDRCVGCGKCAKECPASVIEVKEVLL